LRSNLRWASAIALLIALEGRTLARTTPFEVNATGGVTTPHGDDDLPTPARATGDVKLVVRQTICHLSHHPRDGGRTPQRVCPVMVADARADVFPVDPQTVAPVASVPTLAR